jgi:hypothetical protein
LIPTYAVDYPVASQKDGYLPLLEFLRDGSCQIGAQLHPWVTPPLRETISERNSFPGNLPYELELAKLRQLTETISDNLGVQPKLYRAGRYGAGPNTAEILRQLHYEIDCSVLPHADLTYGAGPDYRAFYTAKPYWFGQGRSLLELPVTVGMAGLLAPLGSALYPSISSPLGRTLRAPGILARLRLLDRIRLTPEGTSLEEAKRVTRSLLRRNGQRVFVLTFHTPSLEPGHTPYVQTRDDLDRFLAWIEEYLSFFFGEIGGVPATPAQVRESALAMRDCRRG